MASLLLTTGCGGVGDSFVEVAGRKLVIGEETYSFVGVNIYDAASTDGFSCRPESRLDDEGLVQAFETLRASGVTVVRFWAYQTYTDGAQDWSGVDRVIAAAEENGMRVMPVLEDGPGDCSTGSPDVSLDQVDGDTWYTNGYRQPLGTAALSYRDYVRTVAEHYRDEPTILAWTLVNEAETEARTDDGRSALVPFARDVAAVIRSVDPNHLITLGTQGNGAPGASGADFRDVYALPELDFAEVHDWPRNGSSEDEALPGAEGSDLPDPASGQCVDRSAPLACSFAIADELDIPLVVGEAGVRAEGAQDRRRRAEVFEDKITAASRAGASGYLVWHYHAAPTDGFDVVAGTDDPLLDVLARRGDADQAQAG